jgi:hypothetical protein
MSKSEDLYTILIINIQLNYLFINSNKFTRVAIHFVILTELIHLENHNNGMLTSIKQRHDNFVKYEQLPSKDKKNYM